ncbi:protein misato [Orussus abietinus]|uniref:protein misato n=1 Tax=Orussus abietinus TaxID=222816 RepID=UPI000626896F|nr:protein misato [Orussus abietinus]XP_012270032.1 protein misato [Orussus abietinus]XP_023287482.1 protein misato [Orussus abietinus]
MTVREILTLQFGHYSNFIGTHWWNIQECNFSYDPDNPTEINHDVLYREGESPKREVTYTPRLLTVDLNGTLGYLNERGDLYDSAQQTGEPFPLWESENIDVTKESAPVKPPFIQSLDQSSKNTEPSPFNLEQDVNVWTDFLVPRFHPRTINIIKGYKHECSVQPFDIFNYGQNIWKTTQFNEDFSDRIRAYVEECDLMQGFHVIMDSTNGFGGLGTSCIEHLRDEYGKSILAFPVIDSRNAEPSASDLVKVINIALSWQHTGEYASLFSPLCAGDKGWLQAGNPRHFNNLNYDLNLKYHSSALLATALDTLTLRYRQKEYPLSSLSDLCADLNKMGRKAAATSLTLPFPMTAKRDFIDVLDDFEGSMWTSITPSCEISTDRHMRSLALRGIPEERLKRPLHDARRQMAKPAYRCSTVHEMMSLYLAYTSHASATHLTTIKAGLKIKVPYPAIFNNNVHGNGDIAAWPVGETVKSVPVMAGLHSGDCISGMFESLHTQASRVKTIKRFHAFQDSGLEEDEFKQCLHHLLDSKEAYEDHYI